MTGLVVAAHAGLAEELIKAAEMIVGKLENVAAVGINPEDSVESIRNSLTSAMEAVSAQNIIIMTDMFGGTPANMSLSFLKEGRIEVLTGVNLPMIIKFSSDRDRYGVSELAAQIRNAGKEAVAVAGDYLKK